MYNSQFTSNPYKLALESQNACNSLALINSLQRIMLQLNAEPRQENGSTTDLNRHPILRLFLEQLVYLNGGTYTEGDGPTYSEAYSICEEKS